MFSYNNCSIWNKYERRDDDIIIASTPKSGTTWLQQIVCQLVLHDKEEQLDLDKVSPWIDTTMFHDESFILDLIEKQKHRRFFKTHSLATDLPDDVIENSKIIYITRDFREVVWSFYNHIANYDKKMKKELYAEFEDCSSPKEMWDYIIKHKGQMLIKRYRNIWSYFVVNKSWFKLVGKKNILFLHYDDLKKDTKGGIKRIAEFIGCEFKEEILEKCSYEYMKEYAQKIVPLHFRNSLNTCKNFIKNKSNWDDELTIKDMTNYLNILSFFFNKEQILFITN